MDCVLMAQQIQAGQKTLGIPAPPSPPPWMAEIMKWVKSQPLLLRSDLISGTRLVALTYHPKAMPNPSTLVSAARLLKQTYHATAMGKPSPLILVARTYHSKPMGHVPIFPNTLRRFEPPF